MQDFKSLKVWQKANTLTLAVYQVTAGFPQHENFGIRAQLRRAAVNIPSKIAEGCGRTGEGEMYRCLGQAMGHASELEYLTLLARDLHFLPDEVYSGLENDTVEVKRMLAGLLGKVRTDD